MKRMGTLVLAGLFTLSAPALLRADEVKKEVKRTKDSTEVNTKTEHTRADGSKVTNETKKTDKTDGTGEAKSETKTETPSGTTVEKKTKKAKRSKNLDGSMETTTETKTEHKK